VKNKKVFFILPFVLLSLVLGIYTGWLRMGWNFPMTQAMGQHGLIMIGSFLGTLILIERIVAFKKYWLYLVPLINALSLPAFFFQQEQLAIVFLLIGSTGLLAVYLMTYQKYRERYILIMMVGGALLVTGLLMLLIQNRYPVAVPYWIGFLLLTILGERIDLAKFLPRNKIKEPMIWIFIVLFILGLFTQYHQAGHLLTGAGMVLIAFWLMKFDIVNKSIKSHGIHQYIGLTLFSGYIWLFISGLFMVLNLDLVYFYDALLHSFFLGFVFLMIFAHGPIIFPGVVGLSFTPFHKSLYFWTFLLNLSLLFRIITDLLFLNYLRQISGVMNGMILIGFFINLVFIIRIKLIAAKEIVE
jgi:hypothetical protein